MSKQNLSPLFLTVFYLSGSYLDIEVAPLVGDLEDLWPGKAVDPQPVAVDEQAVGADTQHDVDAFRILRPSAEMHKNC